MRNSILLLT